MISYFQDYVTIGAVLGFGLFLVVLLLGVASVLRPNKPYPEKLQTYECGVDPVGTGWSQTYVRYYISYAVHWNYAVATTNKYYNTYVISWIRCHKLYHT